MSSKEYVKVGEELTLNYGKSLPARDRITGQYEVVGSNGVVDRHNQFAMEGPGIVVGRKGSVGALTWLANNFWAIDTTYYASLNGEGDLKYWYYQLSDLKLDTLNSHAAVPGLNRDNVYRIEVLKRSRVEQEKIAKILGDLDRKIELNRQKNETLEQIGQSLFKQYFVDKPESDSWEKGTLKDIVVNFDSKRIPVSSRERVKRKKVYRYFGATSVMDYIDDYLFDGTYLLFAEDGTVIKEDGTPVLQYVWGKFWVNNHAHVLQAKKPFTVEYLYLLLKATNIQSLVSGAVQLKVNQGALNSIKIAIPPDDIILEFSIIIEPIFKLYRRNSEEIITLGLLKDSILPKLMSGEIKV